MNSNGSIIQTPFHGAHSHFYDYIPDFPGLPVGDSLEDNHKKIMKQLREQLRSDVDHKAIACLRDCFKLPKRRYVEFCLQQKCGKIKFEEAADVLGLLKKQPAPRPKLNEAEAQKQLAEVFEKTKKLMAERLSH